MSIDSSPASLKSGELHTDKSLFSRQAALQRYRGVNAEEITEEDIEAAESEMALDTLKSLVMNDMDKQSHPIIVIDNNICDLV